MALLKEIVAENGVKTKYHRIAMIKIDVRQQISVLVHSYVDEEGRDVEKLHDSGSGNLEYAAPYIIGTYISLPYEEDMGISDVYSKLKGISPFDGADDV